MKKYNDKIKTEYIQQFKIASLGLQKVSFCFILLMDIFFTIFMLINLEGYEIFSFSKQKTIIPVEGLLLYFIFVRLFSNCINYWKIFLDEKVPIILNIIKFIFNIPVLGGAIIYWEILRGEKSYLKFFFDGKDYFLILKNNLKTFSEIVKQKIAINDDQTNIKIEAFIDTVFQSESWVSHAEGLRTLEIKLGQLNAKIREIEGNTSPLLKIYDFLIINSNVIFPIAFCVISLLLFTGLKNPFAVGEKNADLIKKTNEQSILIIEEISKVSDVSVLNQFDKKEILNLIKEVANRLLEVENRSVINTSNISLATETLKQILKNLK